MTPDDFNAFCASQPFTTHGVQWSGSHVWKVGGKVFAICRPSKESPSFTFKVSAIAYEILREQPSLRPAPYPRVSRPEMDPALRKPGSI